MALSLQFASFARSITRRCMARPIAAALTALALGGAVAGGALALSPTVDTPLVFRGGVNIVIFDVPSSGAPLAYTVPQGRKFMLTDLVISNDSDTSPAAGQLVITASAANCSFQANRTAPMKVPAGGTLHVPFVTGIGFTAGQFVCIANEQGDNQTRWTIRGYLFE